MHKFGQNTRRCSKSVCYKQKRREAKDVRREPERRGKTEGEFGPSVESWLSKVLAPVSKPKDKSKLLLEVKEGALRFSFGLH